MSNLAPRLLILTCCVLLSACTPGLSVKMGSQTFMVRENKIGTAIVPMEDVDLKCMQLQPDGKTILATKITIKSHIVMRVGIQYIGRDDQVLSLEKKQFKAMVPDKDKKLVLTDFTLDERTGIKIGTTRWEETNQDEESNSENKPK